MVRTRGLKSEYNLAQHADTIYFCTDTREIILNGKVQVLEIEGENGEVLAWNGAKNKAKWANIYDLIDLKEVLAYGIQWDENTSDSICTRIGNLNMHRLLPIQSKMRRCLMLDDGTINYYLDANNSLLKEDGTSSNLDGTDGLVMVELPEFYWYFEREGSIMRAWLSECPLPHFTKSPRLFVSAYEAAIDREEDKLASVVNKTPRYRGGDNASQFDDENQFKTMLGKPGGNKTVDQFRQLARNRGNAGFHGVGWNMMTYEISKKLVWLYTVEYANMNSRIAFNNQPSEFKTGGLGIFHVNFNKGLSYNGLRPLLTIGLTNSLGNNTGIVLLEDFDSSLLVKESSNSCRACSYRGIENPFDHMSTYTDGTRTILNNGIRKWYISYDPSNFGGSVDLFKLIAITDIPTLNKYVQQLAIPGELIPSKVSDNVKFYNCAKFTELNERGIDLEAFTHFYVSTGFTSMSSCFNINLHNNALVISGWGTRLTFYPEDYDN